MDSHAPTADSTVSIIHTWFAQLNISDHGAEIGTIIVIATALFLLSAVVTLILRRIFLPVILGWVRSNNYQWDDALVKSGFLQKISWFIPVMVLSLSADTVFDQGSSYYIIFKRLTLTAYVIVAVQALTALLNAINDIHNLLRKNRQQYLQAYIDAGKIVIYVLGAIFITSIFTGRSPWGIVSVLGGLTAVTMLVFKDSILGFVASIQLSATDMVRVGDWIEMPQYGADGDVTSISIHSVKVQNWDKTVTTIPTHALVANSFKNWRGMTESGGRRIKRALYIDMNSIQFCDEAMLKRFNQISILQEYLNEKDKEIGPRQDGEMAHLNQRCQTNIGIFRAYICAYLNNNKHVHKNMTFLVRQLPPTEHGLPLEIYVFSNDQIWAHYEAIQADIFDHLLAAITEFDLRIFQSPSGHDMQIFTNASK